MADTTLAYECAPRIGWSRHVSLGRLLFSVGRRLDLPSEWGFEGDRVLGWAGVSLGHCHVNVCWR